MRRFVLVGVLAALVAGCNGGTNSSTPTAGTTAAPTASPTASPVPTATPVPLKSENYFPITNRATYTATRPGRNDFATGQLATASPGSTCSASLGSFGDFAATFGGSIIPNTDVFVNAAYASPLISKNAAGDVYVVGYLSGGAATCVQPYPIAKAQMVKGTGWTFVDLAGVSRTAVVVSDHATATFTVPGTATTTTYTGVVAQVSYGSDQTIYWAAGYGPAETLNTFTNAGGTPDFPSQVTASNWTLDPASK